ncbi:MAG: hypothetical protein UY35_C0007G0019 [Candidatus Saccharibacteria bacterium GW2011_GWC2_48_9]|nr:MAG: hypothetical protein UY35_C0007G0019 [Candidatus Saccharibacteria bacterium GW2011_GWC2_48_9]HCH34673.1 hypothetical protein [Candidatus Saccharibacteria bacterium]
MRNMLTKRTHPVFIVASLSSGILLGCLLAYAAPSAWLTSWVWWIVWLFWLCVCFWRSLKWAVVVALLVGMMMGYGRGASELASWVNVEQYGGQQVMLRGVVREDPEKGAGSELRLRLDSVSIDGETRGGVYWVTVSGDAANIERSDAVSVQGELQEGFGTFAASMFRAQVNTIEKGVRFDPLLGVRNSFADAIHSTIPDPQAALGIGYILGQKRALPLDFEEALLLVGLTHVVVASGYNLTILVRLSRRLFERVSRYTSVMVSGGLIVAFIGITGLSPSMSRAGLVAGLSLVAWYYGRTVHPAILMLVTAALSVLFNPSYLWGDVGWMLSFAAFAGVMFLAPLLQAYFYGEQKPGIFRQILGETFSAQLVTLPIILVAFGVMSNVALVANVLVLPLVPLAMLLTFFAGLATLISPIFGEYASIPAYWLLSYMKTIIEYFAELPWTSTKAEASIATATAMYAVMLLLIVVLKRSTGLSFRRVNLVE